MDGDGGSLQRTMAFSCKICHDEDEESNMEIPCSCRGTLKYAHRECVQRWCNEKGGTTCEICLQQFKPGYAVSPSWFPHGGLELNYRGNWEVSRRDWDTPQVIDMDAIDHNFLDSDYGDYAVISSRSPLCCRVVTVIFLVLLFLRHTLSLVIGGPGDQTISFFMTLMLSSIGILLPIYVMVKALSAIKYRRQRQRQEAGSFDLEESVEGNEPAQQVQPQPHLIHVL